jgi:hypothetical protein
MMEINNFSSLTGSNAVKQAWYLIMKGQLHITEATTLSMHDQLIFRRSEVASLPQ